MITKCMLRTGGGGNSEVNFASGGGSEFSDSSSSVSIDEIVANPCITGTVDIYCDSKLLASLI